MYSQVFMSFSLFAFSSMGAPLPADSASDGTQAIATAGKAIGDKVGFSIGSAAGDLIASIVDPSISTTLGTFLCSMIHIGGLLLTFH